MFVKKKKMPSFIGATAGQEASIALPIGLTYHMIQIRLKADLGLGVVDVPAVSMKDVIGDIKLMVNGQETLVIDAANLVKMNAYYGQPEVDGVLNLYLTRPQMREMGGEDQGAYGTIGLQTFTLTVKLKTGAPLVGNPTMTAFALLGTPQQFGTPYRIQRYSLPVGVTGTKEFTEIRRGRYALYAVHLATAAISEVTVTGDDVVILDQADRQILDFYSKVAKNVPNAGLTHIDFLTRRRVLDAVGMDLVDFRMKLNFTATGNFDVFVEHLDGVAA